MNDTRTVMDKQVVTIGEVRAAFETLLGEVHRECDSEMERIIHFAGVDVLMILGGEWLSQDTRCGMGEANSEEVPF